jgi:archaellum component FlaC
MNIDERIEALTMNLELVSRDIQDLKVAAQQDGENIRALVRIAEIHERRPTQLEGGE